MALNNRKTILVLVDWFVPGTNAGGPIRSVYSMVKLLKDKYRFKIFTRNTDHNSTVPYQGIQADQWVKFDEDMEIFYCSAGNLDQIMIKHVLETVEYDKVYLNSFYSKWFSIVPLQVLRKMGAAQKVILAPRGMLGKGALQVKPLKKKLFIAYAKAVGLHKNIVWQATGEGEKKDIEKVFGKNVRIKIAGNLSYIQPLPFVPRKKQVGELNLFFLSRLVPIKNLHAALMALKNIRCQVTYAVYGPVEDENYYHECLNLVKTLPANIRVEFKGVLNNEDIQQCLQQYHVLLMPTLNENFGHSILESFCAGCPVIISDQTPWQHLQERKAGYNVSVFQSRARQELASAIEDFAGMDENTFNTWSHNAYVYGTGYQQGNEQIEAAAVLFN